MTNEEISLTAQLQRFSDGDRATAELVLRTVLPKLHQIAVRQLSRERNIAPLSPTELIHEVWLRSLHKGGFALRDRQHFYSIAACAMRRVLVDTARARLAQIRGGGEWPVALEDAPAAGLTVDPEIERVVEIGRLMEILEKRDPEGAKLVELHYFAGFTMEEVSEITGLTVRQLKHRWRRAQEWLKDRLNG